MGKPLFPKARGKKIPNSTSRYQSEYNGDIPQLFGDIPRLCSEIPAVFSEQFNMDTLKALLVSEKASACMQLRNEQSNRDEKETAKHYLRNEHFQ